MSPRPKSRREIEREQYLQTPASLAQFANAVRAMLGLSPLGNHDSTKSQEDLA